MGQENDFGSDVLMILLTFSSQLVTIPKGCPDLNCVLTAVENENNRNYPIRRFNHCKGSPITQEETSA